ncbi:MAG: SMC family ATPase [Methanotrichaceae archaeon]|nr:SMC family ATPase [Methanotrichaceae archaeon]
MQLNSLAMRNFKKYRRAEVIFEYGLTGIVGNNGVGKSTIVEAIAWALYGSKASPIKRELLKNTSAKDSEMVEVKLNLGLGKQELSVYRAMKGKNLAPEASLFLDGQVIASSSKEVDQKLEEILKISYQDFMKTFYSRQKDLDNLLKETSTGKREYFLKLLGLEDIKTRAMELIKYDRVFWEMEKSKLDGALAEIGDIETRIEITSTETYRAKTNLSFSRQKEVDLTKIADEKKHGLSIQTDKKLNHDLLAEKMKMLVAAISERKEIIAVEKQRLEEIETSRKILANLEPKIERLKQVKTRLEELEPRRREFEKLHRNLAGLNARIEGTRRLLQENEQRLALLQKDRSDLEKLEPREVEYSEVEARFQRLEALREDYRRLQTHLDGQRIRLEQEELVIAKVERTVFDLIKISNRFEEIKPLVKRFEDLEKELAEASRLKDLWLKLEDLNGKKDVMKDRRDKLTIQATRTKQDMYLLGNLAAQEVDLREQDKDLDQLSTELNNILANLKSDLGIQESVISEAYINISRIKNLGKDGLCPACERPLGDQHNMILNKHEKAIYEAERKRSKIIAKIQIEKEKLDGVAISRSDFKKAFDELNVRKNRKAELLASLRGFENQIAEIETEIKGVTATIESLGKVSFDPQRFADMQKELESLQSVSAEYNNLSVKLEELPNRKAEFDSLQEKIEKFIRNAKELRIRIDVLGYSEQDFVTAKARLSDLKPDHNTFHVLSQKVQDIPSLQNKVAAEKEDFRKIQEAFNNLQKALNDLDFDPLMHEQLLKEQYSLSKLEEETQRIIMSIAPEPEILKRMQEATDSLARLGAGLDGIRDSVKSMDYSEKHFLEAKEALDEAEKAIEAARKDALDGEIVLRVLEEEISRLKHMEERKIEYKRNLSLAARQLDIVDSTRSSIIKFMDQVLFRVKDDIARIAGEILEELSGKYSVLKIDEDINILVEEGGDFYPISRYSGGETDMIAVSVRVAISEYLMRFAHENKSYSFLILDEIFGSQDQNHRENMINMLRKLEERFPQILAISHISDVQGQFDTTLQVIEDSMGNSRIDVL